MSFGFTKLPGLTLQVPLDYTTSTPEPRRTNPLFSNKSAPTKCTNQRDLFVGLVTRTFLDSEFSFLSFETTTHKKTGKSQHTNMGPNFEVRINKPKVFPKFVIHENTNGFKAVTHLFVARGVCSTFCSSARVSKELIIESRSWRHRAAAQMRHKGFFTGSVCSTFCSSARVSKELIIESRSWRHWAATQMRHKGFFTGSVCSTFCSSAGVSKELIIKSRSWRHWAAAQMRHKVFSQAVMASARSMRCREPISGLIVASKGLVGEVQVA